MHEIVINLHMHTRYSDGHLTHEQIADSALKAGIDAAIVTDHNIWINKHEKCYKNGDRRVLLIIGEEIHDQARHPQKSHLLVFGVERELAALAFDPQRLLDTIRQAGGLAFIAHPVDPASPAFHEPDISWVDWHINGYTGIELWNAMSEFKSLLKGRLHGLYYALNPRRVNSNPFPAALKKWDELLTGERRVVAVGGSDAHGFPLRIGPIRRTLYPYEFHFRAINTHLLVPDPLSGDIIGDKQIIFDALRKGHAFIGYDLPAPTRGFRFTGQGLAGMVQIGDEISAKNWVTLQVRLPQRVECRLICNGNIIKTWRNREICTYITTDPGAYRIETYIHYLGRKRGWIFSNPIYLL